MSLLRSAVASALCLALLLTAAPAAAASRIKDIATFEGVRDNLLVGYGLVVGLSGTGDNLDDAVFTQESLVSMLERLGVNTRGSDIESENVAAVMVTAVLPPFSRQGSRIDVTISALGTAESLQGGTLMVTPLVGADGEVYAVAQGQLAVGGFAAQGQAQQVTQNIPTSGRIANGAIIEREIPFDLAELRSVKIALRNPDFTTARRMSQAINAYLGTRAARAMDPGTVQVQIPPAYDGDTVGLLTDIEQLRVDPDTMARVVIDEQSGIIVIGQNVQIDPVAIAQGNLTIRVTETPQVSQPNPFTEAPVFGPDGLPAGADAIVVPRTEIEVDEDTDARLRVVEGGVTLQDLVDGLNSLGVGPRDMIGILQAIKAAGALQADLEVM